MTSDPTHPDSQRQRPGCVSAYAILLWLSAALVLAAGCFFLVAYPSTTEDLASGLLLGALCAGFFALLALIPAVQGLGLWRMRPWGWWLTVTLAGLGVVAGLIGLLPLLTAESIRQALIFIGADIGNLIISIIVLIWFVQNRTLFLDSQAAGKAVIGAEGQVIESPSTAGGRVGIGLLVAGGLLVALCLVAVLTTGVLALLGPEIGDVFSEIIDTLETPAPR